MAAEGAASKKANYAAATGVILCAIQSHVKTTTSAGAGADAGADAGVSSPLELPPFLPPSLPLDHLHCQHPCSYCDCKPPVQKGLCHSTYYDYYCRV